MSRYMYTLICLFCFLTGVPRAQSSTSWTFPEAELTVSPLYQDAAPGSAEKQALRSIRDSLRTLSLRYPSADTKAALVAKVGVEYYETVADDLAVLRALPNDATERLSLLQDVERDMAVKAHFQPGILGAGKTSIPPTVKVTLVVGRPNDPSIDPSTVSIHRNSCARGFKMPGTVMRSKLGVSTEIMLPPACFFFWAQSGDKVLQSKRRDIGDGNQAEDTVDFF